MKSKWRPFIVVAVLLTTAVVFVRYFQQHPEVRHQLGQTSLGILASLFILYLLAIGALALCTIATLRLCHLKVDRGESFLLTAYTAVINFFGPLQSGPAFRAVYLKKKYNLDLKMYAFASLGYLLFWGIYSCLFVLSGVLKWWLLPVSIVGLLATWFILRSRWIKPRLAQLDLHGWYYLALATFLQILFVTAIYFIELRAMAPGTSLSQAIIYTGAANLALYVSLTPGAIGFRESFLVFSKHLHHLSNNTIVAANILDRSVYIVLLLFLAIFIFGTHTKARLEKSSVWSRATSESQ